MFNSIPAKNRKSHLNYAMFYSNMLAISLFSLGCIGQTTACYGVVTAFHPLKLKSKALIAPNSINDSSDATSM